MFLLFPALREMSAQGSSYCETASASKALEKGLTGLGLVVEFDTFAIFGIKIKGEQFRQTLVVFSIEETYLWRDK